MRVSTALACCLIAGVGVVSLPREAVFATLPYWRWLHIITAIGIVADGRRLQLSSYPSGMGKRHWQF